jgi:hypothetical protein
MNRTIIAALLLAAFAAHASDEVPVAESEDGETTWALVPSSLTRQGAIRSARIVVRSPDGVRKVQVRVTGCDRGWGMQEYRDGDLVREDPWKLNGDYILDSVSAAICNYGQWRG